MSEDHPYVKGRYFMIRTVTMVFVGKLAGIYDKELLLTDCAWIADTGRLYNFLKDGTAVEVEPIPGEVIISRGAIIDVAEWNHKPFDKQIPVE